MRIVNVIYSMSIDNPLQAVIILPAAWQKVYGNPEVWKLAIFKKIGLEKPEITTISALLLPLYIDGIRAVYFQLF